MKARVAKLPPSPANLLSPMDERKPSPVPLSPMEPTNLLSHLDERKQSPVDGTGISSRKEVTKAITSMSGIPAPHDIATQDTS
jgi:hypothetical protein